MGKEEGKLSSKPGKSASFKPKLMNRFTMLSDREDFYKQKKKNNIRNFFLIGKKNIFEIDTNEKEKLERERKVAETPCAEFNKNNGSIGRGVKTKITMNDHNHSRKPNQTKQKIKEDNGNQNQFVQKDLDGDMNISENKNGYKLMRVSTQKCDRCFVSHAPYVKFCRWSEEKNKKRLKKPNTRTKPKWNMLKFTDPYFEENYSVTKK